MADFKALPPQEAIDFFRGKGLAVGFAWQDVWQSEHARAFTVAKAMSRDLLEDIRSAVDRAIADGTTLETFRKELTPILQKRGWWGRRSMLDPLTGEQKIVQLGSPRRLKTILEVNMRSAYAAGRWTRAQRVKGGFPYLRYVTAEDAKVRPEHQSWHGVIRRVDDQWWDTHYPPCGWNCRCQAVPVSRGMLERRGWSVTDDPPSYPKVPYVNPRSGEVIQIERGIDPGFAFNVGKAYLDGVSIQAAAGTAVPKAPMTVSGLSYALVTAIQKYTGDAFDALNARLRGIRNLSEIHAAEAELLKKQLDRAFAPASLPEDMVVWRQVKTDAAAEYRKMDLRPGSIIRDPGFMSTTRSERVANQGKAALKGIVWKLLAKKGAKAYHIVEISRVKMEDEVLFARNRRLRVVRWDAQNDIYELEVLNDDDEPFGSMDEPSR